MADCEDLFRDVFQRIAVLEERLKSRPDALVDIRREVDAVKEDVERIKREFDALKSGESKWPGRIFAALGALIAGAALYVAEHGAPPWLTN